MMPLRGALPSAVADRSQHMPRVWAKDQASTRMASPSAGVQGSSCCGECVSGDLELGQFRTGELVMKKLLLATTAFVVLAVGPASAADLRPAYRAAPLPPPVYSWTGLYWGVNIGYSWGQAKDEATLRGVGT